MVEISERSSKKIKYLSFICALLIITIHAFNLEEYNISSSTGTFEKCVYFLENFISQGVARIAVPMFFLFSSFLFFYNVIPQKRWFVQKFQKRFHSLVIPYLFWNVIEYCIFLLPYFIVPLQPFMNGYIQSPSVQDFLEGLFLFKYNYTFWFVYNLILFVAFSPIIYLILKNEKIGFSIIAIFLILWVSGYCNFKCLKDLRISFDAITFCSIGAYYGIHYNMIHTIREEYKYTLSKIGLVMLFLAWILLITLKIALKIEFLGNIGILVGIFFSWLFAYTAKQVRADRSMLSMRSADIEHGGRADCAQPPCPVLVLIL